jgi:hypothetical protein
MNRFLLIGEAKCLAFSFDHLQSQFSPSRIVQAIPTRFGREKVMGKMVYIAILILVYCSSMADIFGQSEGAPRIYEVEFVHGVYSDKGDVFLPSPCPRDVPQGVCGNGNSKGYYINGKKGDRISISLKSNKQKAVFSIFYPDHDIFVNGSAVTSWIGTLPADGSYWINVYTNTGSTPFSLQISRRRR